MRTPDFFIIGAPKCGTTAIYSYLRSHPSVFMPSLKEPHYFSHDLPGRKRVFDEDAYCALFADASPERLVGEASASYLFSTVAVDEILRRNPHARVIAILRNPIEMAYALHAERLRSLTEDVSEFEQAWNLQDDRAKGRFVPARFPEPKMLQYRDLCSFGRQVRRLFSRVPAPQRAVFIFEEFRRDPLTTYAAMLRFLGLPDDGRRDFPQVNSNRVVRHRTVAEWHRSARDFLKRSNLFDCAKTVLNAVGVHPSHALRQFSVAPEARSPLSERFRRQMAAELIADVRELEGLLHRRLDCWEDFRPEGALKAGDQRITAGA